MQRQEEHFEGKVAQKAVILRNGEVLLVRDPRTPDTWELPGGRLNIDEHPYVGLAREIKEELGLEVVVEEPIMVEQFIQENEGKRALMVAYRVSVVDKATLQIDESEVAEVKFVTLKEVLTLKLFPEYRAVLELVVRARGE